MKKSKSALKHPATATAVNTSPLSLPAVSRTSRAIRYGLYALIVLGAVGVRAWLKGPSIPLPPLDGLDPVLAEQIENAKAAIWKSPRQPEKWGRMGMLLAAHSFTGEAVQCFEKAEDLDPERWKWPYLRAIAQEHSNPAAARDALREAAVVAGDDDPLPRLLLVERLLETGEMEEAAQHLEFARHYWPDDPRANMDLARLLYAHGDSKGAVAPLEKAVKDRHTRKAAYQLLAQVHRRLANQQAADEALAAVKSLAPDEPWPDPWREELENYRTAKGAYIARIHELGRRGDYAKLKRAAAESIDHYPELAHLVTGRERLAAGDAAGAETALREAVRLDPLSVDALISLGEALTAQKQYRSAEDAFRRAVEAEPTNGVAHLHLGRSLIDQKEYEAALLPLRAAVQYMPTSPEAHKALAEALAAAGEVDEAEEHRRIAERLGPASAAGR